MEGKTLTIPASELRVGDRIINYGEALSVTNPAQNLALVEVHFQEVSTQFWDAGRLLTIERHEPEVTERWFCDDPEDGFKSLEEALAAKLSGETVTKFTWHGGVLHAVEIVGAPHD